VLATPSRRIVSEFLPVVSAEAPLAQITEVQGYPSDNLLREIGHSGSICFLDLITDRKGGAAALDRIISNAPRLAVVALVPAKEPQAILEALRAGASEFLTQPFSNEQFRTVLEKLALKNPELMAEQGRVLAIVPAKGSCGASTIAFNLAVQLRKLGSSKTLLADLDPITGIQAFQMKLKPSFSFLDALTHTSNLDGDLWRGIVQSYSKMDVLLPPDSPVDGVQDVQDAKPLLDFARLLYDFVVADLGSAYGEWTLSAVRAADEIYLVTTNELPSLQAAQRVIGYYDAHGLQRQKIRLVVNRFSKEIGLTKDMVETALQTDVFQVLPSDYEGVQRALLDGKPIAPTATIGKQITQLASRIVGKPEKPKPAEAKPRSGNALAGLLGGLFSRST
jgi:pilus assembly protein CpaE